jgi:DNA polymerase III subunit epsilon
LDSPLYAIIDTETTGNRVTEDKIIEIGIVIFDGQKIIDQYHSLIHPERHLPEYITQLTGITYEMLENAPKFYEIAKDIIKFTEGHIFVAHNVHFDYSFLKSEFRSLGFRFSRKTLCTVRLSRKFFPQYSSHSLANMVRHLNIPLDNHHRALDDALAATEILKAILERSTEKALKNVVHDEIQLRALPPKIGIETYQSLPEEPGVYYFYNETGQVIYVGKSNNIKKRVGGHFSTNLDNRKTIEFKNQIADISFEVTGNELIALLYESDEIKKLQPLFNRAQRRSRFNFGIFSHINQKGYIVLTPAPIKNQKVLPVHTASNMENAREILYRLVAKFGLCMKLCGLYHNKGACFDYQIKRCQGACIDLEAPEIYNQKVEEAIDSLGDLQKKSFFIVLQGRDPDEKGVVCVEKGRYLGFGYLEKDTPIQNLEQAKDFIKKYPDNKDVQKIIYGWLKKNQREKIVYND